MSSPRASLDALHAADLGGGPVLDAATFGALQDLAGDDEPDLVRELVALFLRDSAQRIASLKRGLESADVGAVGAAAHALKSSAANVGALEFSGACAELERGARVEDVDLDELRTIGVRTCRLYADVVAALSGSRS
ncbi:MAG: Hpt domain-containing protein [Planctomycetota bacterium]|nr:Hpt domain-containing protein [Planctomycetota bacterium]